jgi:Holliday junction DNA helicase RuvA
VISRISGKLVRVEEEFAFLELPPFQYEVFISENARRQLQGEVGKTVELHTLHYLEGNAASGGKLIPRLVGFLNPAEKEFFELFCSVDGVGVKKALRAMVRPVRDIAIAIEEQDAKLLSSLPGVGPATAERVVAKLRRKMPKFALLVGREDTRAASDVQPDVLTDTFQVLLTLGHSESEARKLIDGALAGKKKFKDVDELLKTIYEREHGAS